MSAKLLISITVFASIGFSYEHSHESTPKLELMFQWNGVELKWPNDTIREEYINNKKYIIENNAISAIKVYKDNIYLSLPRLKEGVPITLVRISSNQKKSSPRLEPFPSFEMHGDGDCEKLHLIQSMEIDPNTGWMWILDAIFIPKYDVPVGPNCPSKLIIYDIIKNKEVHRHEFPKSLFERGKHYLNDIVLDYVDGKARYAYISDTLGGRLVVYDHVKNMSYAFTHSSMDPELKHGIVRIADNTQDVSVLGINGMAMSSDFEYVYYSALAGTSIYQIPTKLLRLTSQSTFAVSVRKIGEKDVQGDGMFYGQENMYYSTLGQNAVYKWEAKHDAEHSGSYANVMFDSKTEVAKDMRIQWVDSLSIDENGYLWFTSNNLHKFFGNVTKNTTSNYFVWKINVKEKSYLTFAKTPTGAASRFRVSFTILIILIFRKIVI